MASRSTSEAFPGFERFFVMEEAGDRGFRVEADLPDGPADWAFRLLRAEYHPHGPVSGRWCMGRGRPSDFVFATRMFVELISERVVLILENAGVTGWRTYSVELRDAQGERIDGYRGLSISGRCGPVTFGAQGMRVKQYPGGAFPVACGISFEPHTWDGSDIFVATEHRGFVFASDRVRRLLTKAKVSNIDFVSFAEFEIDPTLLQAQT